MSFARFHAALLVVCAIGASLAQGQLFSGPSSFTVAPFTQAPNTAFQNFLTLSDLSNGFSITGQVHITVVPGQHSGTLLQWEVQRPLDPLFTPAQSMVNTSSLTGFILGPAGALPALGQISSDYTLTGGSTAAATFSYSGSGNTPLNISANTTFFYTPGGSNFLRQQYFVDYSFNGPPGTYVVDFPADSLSDPVPEPAALGAMALSLAALARGPRGADAEAPPAS